MTKKTSPAYRASKEETIPINKLHPFSNHPFHIRHDLEFSELVDSISESGIITPIIVRPKVGVGYEVISGHRRWEACKELGIESIPARVEYIDDDEVTILMVNSNIQREHVLPSEKAFAYKMRMEAMKHQGKATSSQLGTKLRTLDAMGKEVDESRNQIHRYIRLTYLIPSILQMVDDGRIAFNPAVEISYMTGEHQTWLKEEMDMCDATPSLVQSRTLKDMSRNGTLTENYLHAARGEDLKTADISALGAIDGISAVYPIDGDTFTVTGGRTETFVNEDGQEQETIHPLPFEDMVLQYDGSLVTQWGEGIAADQAGYYASDGEKLYYVDFETNECRSLDGAGQIDSYGVLATIKGSSFCRNGIFYYVDDQGIVAYDTTNNSESRILTDTLAPFLQDDVSCVTLIVTDHQAIAVAADLNSETQTVYRYEI